MSLADMPLDHLVMTWQASIRNPELRTAAEVELQSRINNNRLYSRESLFRSNRTLNRTLSVHFIPTSRAFVSFGPYVTVLELILSDQDVIQIANNIVADPAVSTFGRITCTVLDGDSPNRDISFDTSDILEVSM